MVAIVNKIQESVFDASAPLRKGFFAGLQDERIARNGGCGDFPLEDIAYIGEPVVKGAAIKYPDDHIMANHAVKHPLTTSTAADVVGFVVYQPNSMSNPYYNRPAIEGLGRKMINVALIGSGIVMGMDAGEAALDGDAVLFDADPDSATFGKVFKTAAAGRIETGAKFYGAAAVGVCRVKL